MGRGILDLVGLAVTLAFAVPVGLLGLDMLSRGDTLVGGGFLAFAVLMVVLQEYVTMPGDVPGRVASRLLGGVAKDPAEGADVESDGEGTERPPE